VEAEKAAAAEIRAKASADFSASDAVEADEMANGEPLKTLLE